MKLKKNNKYGFTLVELLAVIVILAIALVIAVPKVMEVIEDSKKATFESTAKMVASQAEKAKIQNVVLGKNEKINCDDIVKINDVDYESCSIEFDENQALITMTGNGKFDGYYVCYGTITGATVQEEPCGGTETAKEAFQYEIVYDVKVANKTSCMNYTRPIMVDLYGYTEDDLNTFCSGNIMNNKTFSQHINRMIYEEETTLEELISNGVVTDVKEVIEITGYNSTYGALVNIPRKIDNKLVYGIGSSAFENTTVTGVKLPTSLRYIGNRAFYSNPNCYTGSTGTATNSTETPGCIQLTGELDLSNLTNLRTIGEDAFHYNRITSVKLPSSLEEIGKCAFSHNQISGILDLSNTKVTTIVSYAFYSNQITSVKLPSSLEEIKTSAFDQNQISGILDLSNTKVTTIDWYAFISNQITSVKLPATITTIYNSAFASNPNLTTIINPSGKNFDWYFITSQGTSATCTFATGTCGTITIKAS